VVISLKHIAFLCGGLFVAAACSLVDEDLRDCAPDCEMDYELKLVTNMTTELQTELSLAADVNVSASLKSYLDQVFTDRAHDVDLSFYDVSGDQERLHHEKQIMDASQTSFTLHIPVRQYMHLAVANLERNDMVSLENDARCSEATLHQVVQDTLSPHPTGLFFARLPMDVQEGVDQEFDVRLRMLNCAAALVLDTLGSGVKDIRVYASGFATDFNLADSTYQYRYTPVFKTDKVDAGTQPGTKLCYATVGFPSRELENDTKAESSPWQFRVYSYLPNGSITETLVHVRKQLLAGQLKIVKATVFPNGALESDDQVVGVSVRLDWSPGLEHEIEL